MPRRPERLRSWELDRGLDRSSSISRDSKMSQPYSDATNTHAGSPPIGIQTNCAEDGGVAVAGLNHPFDDREVPMQKAGAMCQIVLDSAPPADWACSLHNYPSVGRDMPKKANVTAQLRSPANRGIGPKGRMPLCC